MNYLAHAWLARHSDEAILGGLLGDFVFGRSVLQDWRPSVRIEIDEILSRSARLRVSRLAGSIEISASRPIWWLAWPDIMGPPRG